MASMRGHLAAFQAAHGDVEDLDGSWHLQADQSLLDAVDERGNDLGMGAHRAPAWPASRRAMAS